MVIYVHQVEKYSLHFLSFDEEVLIENFDTLENILEDFIQLRLGLAHKGFLVLQIKLKIFYLFAVSVNEGQTIFYFRYLSFDLSVDLLELGNFIRELLAFGPAFSDKIIEGSLGGPSQY